MRQLKEFVAKVKKQQSDNADIEEGREADSYKVVILFNSVSDSLLNNEQQDNLKNTAMPTPEDL